jgi:hypothetical protein
VTDSSWDDQSVPRRRASVATQQALHTLVLLDLLTGRYFTLEGSGDRMWELSDGSRTLADIVTEVAATFAAEPSTVRGDALELFERLTREGLVDDAR